MSVAATPVAAAAVAAQTIDATPTKSRPPKRQVTATADVVQQPEAR
jgi:hypothetical protein